MEKPKLRHYVRINAQKFDAAFLNRPEVMRVDDLGEKLAFASSVLSQRGFLRLEPEGDGLEDDRPPLLTFPFLDYMSSLDLSAESLLELGAGNSTLWFSTSFGALRSFETDPQWHGALAQRVRENVALSLVDAAALEDAAFEYRGESFMLVDFAGRRSRCLRRFFERLGAAAGPKAIVLDNADWYRRGAQVLAQRGYLEIPFYGFKVSQNFLSCTSLFIDPARFAPAQRQPFHQPPFSRRIDNTWDELEDEPSAQ